MEGDLNLSQALGGLRIANQTDDSPPPSPRMGTSSSNNTSTIHIPDLYSLSSQQPFSQNSVVSNAPPSQSSSLVGSQHSLSQLQSRPTYPPPTPPSRPTSQFLAGSYPSNATSGYPSQNVSSSTSIHSVNTQMYPDYARMSREPSRGSLSGPSGVASRQSQRERSNTDRSYRQSHPTGPYPPRSGSSRGLSQARFAGEDGGLYNENGPPASSDEWKEKGAAFGVRREIDANGNTVTRVVKKGVKDFNFGRTLGEGSYSTVSLRYFIWCFLLLTVCIFLADNFAGSCRD